MGVHDQRSQAARQMIADHHARNMLFPAEAFHDLAWCMLLTAFIAYAEDQRLTEVQLLGAVRKSRPEGHRCLYLLGRDGQFNPRSAGDDVTLSTSAIMRLQQYLDRANLMPRTGY